jgi:hypothetical protein
MKRENIAERNYQTFLFRPPYGCSARTCWAWLVSPAEEGPKERKNKIDLQSIMQSEGRGRLSRARHFNHQYPTATKS